MPFSFSVFPGLDDPGMAAAAADRFTNIWADLKDEFNGELLDRERDDLVARVHFFVIDVTPGDEDPVQLGERLQEFLLDSAKQGPLARLDQPQEAISRLLFVGARASLDTWEVEEGRTSRMKALELYIRALQSAHLAHYVNIIRPEAAKLLPRIGFEEAHSADLVRAELITLDSYYLETKHALSGDQKKDKDADGPGDAPKNDPVVRRNRERALSRLRPLSEGVKDLQKGVKEFLGLIRSSVGGLDAPQPDPDTEPDQQILFDLCAVFQLGKRNTERAYESLAKSSLMRPENNFGAVSEGGAYNLRHQLDEGLDEYLSSRPAGRLLSPKHPERADAPLIASLRLRRYELLRDVSRCISIGAIDFLRREQDAQGWTDASPREPRGLLIVDAQLCDEPIVTGGDIPGWNEAQRRGLTDRRSRLIRRLQELMRHIGWEGACYVTRAANVIPGLGQDAPPIDPHAPIEVYDVRGGSVPKWAYPENFSLVLIEIDSSGAYVGPNAVQLLVRHLATLAQERGDKVHPPPVIVFTQTESFGHIQQSLNLGAVAYVLKERLYQLPFQMRRALEGVLTHRPSTDDASSFRALQVLRPEVIVKLKRHDRNYLLRGRRYWPSARTEQESATAPPTAIESDGVGFDENELAWIRELPKADLHCHLGTCIPYDAYEAMARNTAGYALSTDKIAAENEGVRETVLRLALAVALGEHLCEASAGRLHPLVCLAVGAEVATGGRLGALHKFGLGDKIVEAFRDEAAKLQPFEVTSLLVALFERGPSRWSGREAGLPPPRAFLDAVAVAYGNGFARHGRGAFRSIESDDDGVTDNARAWRHGPPQPGRESLRPLDRDHTAIADAAKRLTEKLARIARGWNGPDTLVHFKDLDNARKPETYWRCLADRFDKRSRKAESLLDDVRAKAKAWIVGCDEKPDIPGWPLTRAAVTDRLAAALNNLRVSDHIADRTDASPQPSSQILAGLTLPTAFGVKIASGVPLERYVMLPDRHHRGSPSNDKGLQRYLWGADFLGAEHLQYPENLLLGAYALTSDNACDNVTYSEVRCETPGYCRGGMSARDATDLLCLGLDFAQIFVNTAPTLNGQSLPLVRTSVLLAAKRHKRDEPAREVVSLLEAYLNEKRDLVGIYVDTAPPWWRPTSVVGFDISGNETDNPDWMKNTLEPLKRLSSPITIHAGEAADAKSVWNAVYLHHARRIGHGLRLREDQRLLDYCVSEGICMEMCPNSNVFTNAFHPLAWPEQYPLDPGNAKSAYPLLAYMRRGLEVSVATDNRYIHNPGFRTLSSEYLTAARLSGGLTRWEVLQLVKAGFKNAFLPKREVSILVQEMENRVYRTVSRGWF